MQQDKSPVSEVMSRDVRTCTDEETLDVAARILWESDCGSVPVVHVLWSPKKSLTFNPPPGEHKNLQELLVAINIF